MHDAVFPVNEEVADHEAEREVRGELRHRGGGLGKVHRHPRRAKRPRDPGRGEEHRVCCQLRGGGCPYVTRGGPVVALDLGVLALAQVERGEVAADEDIRGDAQGYRYVCVCVCVSVCVVN